MPSAAHAIAHIDSQLVNACISAAKSCLLRWSALSIALTAQLARWKTDKIIAELYCFCSLDKRREKLLSNEINSEEHELARAIIKFTFILMPESSACVIVSFFQHDSREPHKFPDSRALWRLDISFYGWKSWSGVCVCLRYWYVSASIPSRLAISRRFESASKR